MKVGDYVRTEDGIITKIKMFYEQKWEEPKLIYARFLCENYEIYEYPRQVKSSPNIIDLIEVGDYVNGKKVVDKRFLSDSDDNTYDEDCGAWCVFYKEQPTGDENYDIKSIVTKEQFSQIEYKVGD